MKLGRSKPYFAYSLKNLGWLSRLEARYGDTEQLDGRNADALSFYRRARAMQEKALEPDDRAVADLLTNVGFLYLVSGRYADAKPF